MVWKLKERELTLEEAIEQAKVALKPFWFNSSPLLVVSPANPPPVKKRGAQAGPVVIGENDPLLLNPIDPEFTKKRWLVGFADPMTSGGEGLARFMVELHDRYGMLPLGFLLILKPALKSFSTPDAVLRFSKSLNINFPYCLDQDELLFRVFGNRSRIPLFCLLDQGRIVYRTPEQDPFAALEQKIQSFLREVDPGLPLLPVLEDLTFLGTKKFEVAVGGAVPPGVYDSLVMPQSSGFVKAPGAALAQGVFSEPPGGLRREREGLFLKGKWIRDDDRLATNDPQAELHYILRSPSLSLVAESLGKKNEHSSVEVLIDGLNIVDDFAGEDLKYDDQQTSAVHVGLLKNYRLIKGYTAGVGKVLMLRFPHADTRPVAIYTIRELK